MDVVSLVMLPFKCVTFFSNRQSGSKATALLGGGLKSAALFLEISPLL